MRNIVEKQVDSHTYAFTKFETSKGLDILERLIQLVGEPIAMMGGMSAEEGVDQNDSSILAKAMGALQSGMSKQKTAPLLKDILVGATCDGKPIGFEIHFAQRYGHLFKVIWAALEVQFGDFLDVLKDAAAARQAVGARTESQKVSSLGG